MIYKVIKTATGFTLEEKNGDKHTFSTETQVCAFLAKWAIDDMKLGEERLVIDVERANAWV